MGEEVGTETEQEAYRNDEVENGEGGCCELPDDLVERILAMVPFPDVFKARALSKSWQARFEPMDSHDDDEVRRHLAASFQSKVSEWSPNWKTLCPVFFNLEQGLLAYDRASDSSARIPSLSFIPRHILNCHDLHLEGALLLLCGEREQWETPPSNSVARNENQQYPPRLKHSGRSRRVIFRPTVQRQPFLQRMTVANLLTRRWKRLPPLPATDFEGMPEGAYLFKRLVTRTTTPGKYKVIVCIHLAGGNGQPNRYLTKIYDSESNAWSSKTLVTGDFHAHNNPAYFNGVLYITCGDPRKVLAFNVEEETFENLRLDTDRLQVLGSGVVVSLMVCKVDLFMVVIEYEPSKALQVLKVDLELNRLSEVSRGPPPGLNLDKLYLPYGCDGDNICFQYRKEDSGMVTYNLQEDQWRHNLFPPSIRNPRNGYPVSWRRFVFQPNLNPFLAV